MGVEHDGYRKRDLVERLVANKYTDPKSLSTVWHQCSPTQTAEIRVLYYITVEVT